jgi:hypothetical protein
MSEYNIPACEKWRDLIEQQERSGESVSAFCAARLIGESSLYAWKRKLRSKEKTPVSPASFVEATIAGPAAGSVATWSSGVIEVRLRGGRRVRVGRGFDRDLLMEVVSALEALS